MSLFDYHLYYPVTYSETGCSFKLKTPGYKKEELSVNMVGDLLTITGKSPSEGNFERAIDIPDEYDIQNSKADYKDGILAITIPKKSGTNITIN